LPANQFSRVHDVDSDRPSRRPLDVHRDVLSAVRDIELIEVVLACVDGNGAVHYVARGARTRNGLVQARSEIRSGGGGRRGDGRRRARQRDENQRGGNEGSCNQYRRADVCETPFSAALQSHATLHQRLSSAFGKYICPNGANLSRPSRRQRENPQVRRRISRRMPNNR